MSKSTSIAAAFAALLATGASQAAMAPPADAAGLIADEAARTIQEIGLDLQRSRTVAELQAQLRPTFRLYDSGPSFVKYIKP